MALAAVHTAMNLEGTQNVHPFFSKPHSKLVLSPSPRRELILSGISIGESQPPATIETQPHSTNDDPDYEHHEQAQKTQKKRGRKPGSTNKKRENPAAKNQLVMERFAQPLRGNGEVEGAHVATMETVDVPTLEEDPNQDRRKRQKTASPPPMQHVPVPCEVPAIGSLDWQQQLELEAASEMAPQPTPCAIDPPYTEESTEPAQMGAMATKGLLDLPNTEAADPLTPAIPDSASTIEGDRAIPKKTMKISKNGKLLSSPPPDVDAVEPKKRRVRRTKLKVLPTVTVVKYGHDAASRKVIGEKIEAIMSGVRPAARRVTPKKATPKRSGPPKPTHPFFLGKSAPTIQENETHDQEINSRSDPIPKALKKSAVTPGKLKLESRRAQSSTDIPVFGSRSNRATKENGLAEAPWPAKEIAHVRNLEGDLLTKPWSISGEFPLRARKLKSSVIAIPREEDMMQKLASQLQPAIQRHHDPPQDEFAALEDLRLPSRLLTTGVDIQNEVRSQVVSLKTPYVHPAVAALFSDTEHSLTAFDSGRCEPLSWAQKYTPKYASHVLQSGKEPLVLKDWLQSLTVLSVGGKNSGSKAAEITNQKKPPKKKRKKAQDDFVVDSDEEEEEDMVELPRNEPFTMARRAYTPTSVHRARWTRNKNVVLISGPNGCGKSAMVQAVAKDLDFEIFEINSGSRRSGKDILDKVGDMTENHLVSNKRKEALADLKPAVVVDIDTEGASEALQKDIESGRQGNMMSFFKTTGPALEKPRVEAKVSEPKKASSIQATLPVPQAQRKAQKQSLILLEEADILYEEDQGFWAQVTRLAAQSKRPIIITCTNEALIPMHELPLAAILRLSPPPVSLATDYMVVLAGHEGHILEHNAVADLYRSKNFDLRASITELNLWCQMSVGDRKGGLEWIYQRWPPGNDLDEHGRPLRVASKGTYTRGMGYLSHNVFNSQDNVGYDRTAEMLQESWREWQINPDGWRDVQSPDATQPTLGKSLLADLKCLDIMADSLSAADTYCGIDLPSYGHFFDQPTDPSMPLLSDKARLNYTLAAPVLQVDHATDFSHFDTEMLTQTHLLVQRAFGGRQPCHRDESLGIPRTEEGFTSAILHHKDQQSCKTSLAWPDFSQAFDILAYPPDALPILNSSYNLTASSFDRTFRIVVEDLAPYVRSIVASELVLENQRIRLGNLLSEGGGRSTKRQRTTRAARTALEGGSRDTKRREHWFDPYLNPALVMGTAGQTWAGLGFVVDVGTETGSKAGSLGGTTDEVTGA